MPMTARRKMRERLINPVQGALRYSSRAIGNVSYYTIIARTDAVTKAVKTITLDNRNHGLEALTKYTDAFKNPQEESYKFNVRVVPAYSPEFFSGRVPYAVFTYSADTGVLLSIARTVKYDILTGRKEVEEFNIHTGNVVTKFFERKYDDPVEERSNDDQGRLWVTEKTYPTPDQAYATTTVDGVTAIKSKSTFNRATGRGETTAIKWYDFSKGSILGKPTTSYQTPFGTNIYSVTKFDDGINRMNVPRYDRSSHEISATGFRLNPSLGQWNHEFNNVDYHWNKGELTFSEYNVLDGNKKLTHTLTAMGLPKRDIDLEVNDRITYPDMVVDSARQITNYVYDDATHPLIGRGDTSVTMRIQGQEKPWTVRHGQSRTTDYSNGIMTIFSEDYNHRDEYNRPVASIVKQDLNRRNRVDSRSVGTIGQEGTYVPATDKRIYLCSRWGIHGRRYL